MSNRASFNRNMAELDGYLLLIDTVCVIIMFVCEQTVFSCFLPTCQLKCSQPLINERRMNTRFLGGFLFLGRKDCGNGSIVVNHGGVCVATFAAMPKKGNSVAFSLGFLRWWFPIAFISCHLNLLVHITSFPMKLIDG